MSTAPKNETTEQVAAAIGKAGVGLRGKPLDDVNYLTRVGVLKTVGKAGKGRGRGFTFFYPAGSSRGAVKALMRLKPPAGMKRARRGALAAARAAMQMEVRRGRLVGSLGPQERVLAAYMLDRAVLDLLWAPDAASRSRLLLGPEGEPMMQDDTRPDSAWLKRQLTESTPLRCWCPAADEYRWAKKRFAKGLEIPLAGQSSWVDELMLLYPLPTVILAPEGVSYADWLRADQGADFSILRAQLTAILREREVASEEVVKRVAGAMKGFGVPAEASVHQLPADPSVFVSQRLWHICGGAPTRNGLGIALRRRFRWCHQHLGPFVRVHANQRWCLYCRSPKGLALNLRKEPPQEAALRVANATKKTRDQDFEEAIRGKVESLRCVCGERLSPGDAVSITTRGKNLIGTKKRHCQKCQYTFVPFAAWAEDEIPRRIVPRRSE